MKATELDKLLDDKLDILKWQPEVRQALRELADQYDEEMADGQHGQVRTEQPAIPTVEIVNAFLVSKQGKVAEGSLTSYRHTLNAFASHCPVLPTQPEQLDRYFARFKERRSAASAYAPIKLLYRFAHERYGLPNTIAAVERPTFKDKEPYALTLEESRAVLSACRNNRELGLVHLYLGHALRLDEACRINIGDILDTQLMVRGKERNEYMPLLPETKEILLRLANGRGPQEPLFTSYKGRRLSHKETYNVVKAILSRAGVTKDGYRIATHTLRKTFASLATQAGCNDRIVKRLLRHKTKDITALYVSMPMDTLRANLERYSPIRLLNGRNSQSEAELHKIFSFVQFEPTSSLSEAITNTYDNTRLESRLSQIESKLDYIMKPGGADRAAEGGG